MDYMKISEVAEKFRVSKQAVHKWIGNGILKAEKFGKKTIRIKVEEVEKMRGESCGAKTNITKI